MKRIQRLGDLLINQIAAGEVIERPASVVKELIENALDAGARTIHVELEQGGIELIRVTDDGHGIAEPDLELALASHATSKITEASDLDRIGTMGFRGEALASIRSVSRVSIRSRTSDADGATQIDAEGDVIHAARPASGPVGTSVTARNLFFNTPARRKFLKTARTEQMRCMEWIRDLAMARPAVGFRVTCDQSVKLDLAPDQPIRERVLDLIGREYAAEMLDVHADGLDTRDVSLWGLVGMPALARATSKGQHLFLNGRAIRDRSIQHAFREAYRGLIEPGRHPLGVIMLEVPADRIDVNVHPAKLEVRFRDQSVIHSVVHRAVRDALQRADLTPTIEVRSFEPARAMPTSGDRGGGFTEYFQKGSSSQTPIDFQSMREALEEAPRSVPHDMSVPRPRPRMLQVHKSYVITQDEDGIVIVDQHALHERVMFETLCTRITIGPLESQRLLTPAVVETPHVERLDDLRPLLERIGIAIEPLGPTQVGVHTFSSFLFERNVDPVTFMEEVFTIVERDGFVPSEEEALHEVLDMMACKAAIKAGDSLSDAEIERLLELREQVERSSRCPHGRPTSVRVTIPQIERMFGRR